MGLAALGTFAFAAPTIAANDFKNKYEDAEASRDCGDGDTVDYGGPLKMWPPNHKLQDVVVSATDGSDDDPTTNPTDDASNATTITVTPAATDVAGGDGGPNHDPDYTPGDLSGTGDPTAETEFWLRSERSGKGEGRTYTINWLATFDGGSKTCSSEDEGQSPFTVFVPHDMRGGAGWK